MQNLRPTIDWINSKGWHNFYSYIFYQIWISILVDACNRKLGYESPKVIIEVTIEKLIHYAVIFYSHGWPWPRSLQMENCTRTLGLGEKEEGMDTMSQTNTGLCMRDSFSSSSKVVSFYIISSTDFNLIH